MKPSLTHRPETKSITDLVNLYRRNQLDLEPGFQRQSVWAERDRRGLIDSILRNYPLPAIFLYTRQEDGRIIYDVIDGKQRIESILMFIGEMRGKFWVRTQLSENDDIDWIDWTRIRKKKLQHLIEAYKIPVIEVDGDLGDIIDVFVRINSTGKALTPQEKRHAKYYKSPLLKEADRLGRRFEYYLRDTGILSVTQINRMKHVELMSELMVSINQGDVVNRKAALDKVMATGDFTQAQTRKASKKTQAALRKLRKIFPSLHSTRFRQLTDFYSLLVLVAKFIDEGLILDDRRRNRLAQDLLIAFGTNVDQVRENQRRAIGIKPHQEVYRDYLLTVSQMSDDVNQRRKRESILRNILESLFARKDAQRGFTSEQRRIMWNTATNRRCPGSKCGGKLLSWNDFTLDHIDPHSKGGRSRLRNAALMCRSCNSAKGNRRRR
jgi:hypothetical protein